MAKKRRRNEWAASDAIHIPRTRGEAVRITSVKKTKKGLRYTVTRRVDPDLAMKVHGAIADLTRWDHGKGTRRLDIKEEGETLQDKELFDTFLKDIYASGNRPDVALFASRASMKRICASCGYDPTAEELDALRLDRSDPTPIKKKAESQRKEIDSGSASV